MAVTVPRVAVQPARILAGFPERSLGALHGVREEAVRLDVGAPEHAFLGIVGLPAPAPKAARLELTIDTTEYSHGYFKIVGRAENVGSADAFSPTIKLQVYDRTSKTILADTVT